MVTFFFYTQYTEVHETALHLAAKKGDVELARELLKYGAASTFTLTDLVRLSY
jgi:ankyrin repeat protein